MTVEINAAGTITGLQPNGISSQPVFPGNVVQVVESVADTETIITTTATTSTGLTTSITPSSASNKILVIAFESFTTFNSNIGAQMQISLRRNNSLAFAISNLYSGSPVEDINQPSVIIGIDSPNTTSEVTYDVATTMQQGTTERRFRYNGGFFGPGKSHIIAMEIAG